jgi:hypothetical protein
MADETTPYLGLAKPEVNGVQTENVWGFDLNANFDKIDTHFSTLPGDDAPYDSFIYGRSRALWARTVTASDFDLLKTNFNTHTHTSAGITDFAEATDDRVFQLLTAGPNITLTYDDTGNKLTIAAPVSGGGSGGGIPPIGDYGDISVTNTGLTWTIDPKAVTYAKIQDVAADRILGRSDTVGAVQEIICTAAGRALLDDADAAAQRVTLGADAAYVAKSGDTMTGPLVATTYYLSTGGTFLTSGNNVVLTDRDNKPALALGNTALPVNVYRNDSHYFQDRAGAFNLFFAYSGGMSVVPTTASTSSTTGALTVAGGVGVGGNCYVGGGVSVGGSGISSTGTIKGGAGTAPSANSPFWVCPVSGQYGISIRPQVEPATAIGFFNVANAQVGGITTTAAATAYNTSSSAELKEDLQSFDAGRIVDDTEVYDFKWKGLDERAYGIVAQQAVEVYPQAITHIEDEERDWWGVDYSKYVPVLLQELKAVRARLAELEATVTPKKAR